MSDRRHFNLNFIINGVTPAAVGEVDPKTQLPNYIVRGTAQNPAGEVNPGVRLPGTFEKRLGHSMGAEPDIECGQVGTHPAAIISTADMNIRVEETPKGTQIQASTTSTGVDGTAVQKKSSLEVDRRGTVSSQLQNGQGVAVNFPDDVKTAKMANAAKGACNAGAAFAKGTGFKPFKLPAP
jgi:flagellar hook protein FlgE